MDDIIIDASQMRPDQLRSGVGFMIADIDAIGTVTLPVNVDVIHLNLLNSITLVIPDGYDGQRLVLWFTAAYDGDGTNTNVNLPSNLMLGLNAGLFSSGISASGQFDYLELGYCAPASAWAVLVFDPGNLPSS